MTANNGEIYNKNCGDAYKDVKPEQNRKWIINTFKPVRCRSS
jgi:hypothetical protein